MQSITLTKENSQMVQGWFPIFASTVLSPFVNRLLSNSHVADWVICCPLMFCMPDSDQVDMDGICTGGFGRYVSFDFIPLLGKL